MSIKKQIYENNKILYDGYVENNKYDGYGILYYSNGNINCEGIWENGEIVKTYTKYYEDGKLLYKCYNNIDDDILYDQENNIDNTENNQNSIDNQQIKENNIDNKENNIDDKENNIDDNDSIILENYNTDSYIDLLHENIENMFDDINNNFSRKTICDYECYSSTSEYDDNNINLTEPLLKYNNLNNENRFMKYVKYLCISIRDYICSCLNLKFF